jgi:hypothetical protein
MKKLFGIVLALALLLSSASFACAEDNSVIEINIYHHMSADTARGQATEKIRNVQRGIRRHIQGGFQRQPGFPTYQEKSRR